MVSVLKLQARSAASALPATSLALAASVARYTVPSASGADGRNVIVVPLQEYAPATGAPSLSRTSEKTASADALSIGSLNVTATAALVATAVAQAAGETALVVGATVSATGTWARWPKYTPANGRSGSPAKP